MKLISWNVSGINSCTKKGLIDFIKKENADLYCFQEVKSDPDQINFKLKNISKYMKFWSPSEKKGRSGVAIFSKIKPISVKQGIGSEIIDKEGRLLTLEFKKFFLINAYFPHSHRTLKRLDFKLKFNKLFLNFCKNLKKKKPLIIAADFNVAHKEIDLRNPKQNKKNAGFTIKERNWFDEFLKQSYIDTFREFDDGPGNYTYWTYMNNARKRNIGWRIDYFIINKNLKSNLISSNILNNVYGSDHCPIKLVIDI